VNLCVSSTQGGAVTSDGSSTTCGSGSVAAALPASAAQQQALISILPYVSFKTAQCSGPCQEPQGSVY